MDMARELETQKLSENDDFDLGNFFPYLVRIYYRSVSAAVSNIYAGSYGLSVSEWRTMAVLGPLNSLSASEIVARSSMDKVNVSRAIKGLEANGFLERKIDGKDKRRAVLKLTEKGNRAFGELVPQVKQVEEDCLNGLTQAERKSLTMLMARVQKNAEQLNTKVSRN